MNHTSCAQSTAAHKQHNKWMGSMHQHTAVDCAAGVTQHNARALACTRIPAASRLGPGSKHTATLEMFCIGPRSPSHLLHGHPLTHVLILQALAAAVCCHCCMCPAGQLLNEQLLRGSRTHSTRYIVTVNRTAQYVCGSAPR